MTAGETHTWSINSHLPYYAEVDGFLMSLPDGFTLSPDTYGDLPLISRHRDEVIAAEGGRLLRGDQGENRIASSRNAPEPRPDCLTRMLP